MREELAALIHTRWNWWMQYFFSKSTHNPDGTVTIPAWAVERWTRQMLTEYCDLPDEEKDTDRQEADKVLALIESYVGSSWGLVATFIESLCAEEALFDAPKPIEEAL